MSLDPTTKCLVNCGGVLTPEGLRHDVSVITVFNGEIAGVGDAPIGIEFEAIDMGGRLITPGLIDAHTHAVFAGSRANEFEMRCAGSTYKEIAAQGGGIKATVRALRSCPEDDLFAKSARHVSWMLSCGTTTLEAKSGYGLDIDNELKMMSVIGRLDQETPMDIVGTFLGCHAVPEEYGSSGEYTTYVCSTMLPRVVEQGIARFADMFVEEGYFSHADAERLAESIGAYRDAAPALRLHVDQFSKGGAQLAARLGARTADHLEQTDDEGMFALKSAGTVPVLLPGSVYALGMKKYPDARRMLDLGLPVVLATDFNPGSSPTPSLPMVMSLACTQMGMTPFECFDACTKNASAALGFSDRGVIEVGAMADLVAWDTDDLRDIPYYFGLNLVDTVMKRGDIVVQSSRS